MPDHRRITVDSDVLPRFTACYLRLAGEEAAFIEAHTSHALPRLLAALASAGRKPEDVRWVAVTHAHLDHAAGASALLAALPNAILAAHPRAARHLIQPEKLIASATAVYGAERFRTLYGTILPVPSERVRILEDGDTLTLGDATFTAWHTAGHANHHFALDDPKLETVYTGDTFGLVYPRLQQHGRFILPSTSPTNFDAELARKSIAKVLSLGERFVAPTHFDAWEDGEGMSKQLLRFIDRADGWVKAGAASGDPKEVLEPRLKAAWTAAIREEAPQFGEEELKHLALDIELNAQGLAFAATSMRGK